MEKRHYPVGRWMELATDYPTKALLFAAMQLYDEQHDLIEVAQGQLSGASWNREEWNEEVDS